MNNQTNPGRGNACLCCGQAPSRHFHALQVRTLPVRDLGGEKRVQALGDFVDFSLCENCARQKRDALLSYLKSSLPRCLLFGAVSLAGAALSLGFFKRDQVFFLFGLMAVLCGILGILGTLQGGRQKRLLLEGKSEEEQLSLAAWEAVLESAPKKMGEEDLTYIPLEEKTLSMKNGDLMIMYKLLPGIAVQAYERLHKEQVPPPEGRAEE